ncbi:triose-phosphate isomerase, partial [Alphaproteobacteria bacterium]|nr:triose-phosphate isomerase [Alphaproteobacteria bacterium]
YTARRNLLNYNVEVGAQTCSSKLKGAYTGDVSVEIISDIGCKYCIVGHSERREFHNESNDSVKKASTLLLSKNIIPIICIGESLEIKNKKITNQFIKNQIRECVPDNIKSNLVIAYEPLWAIGSGIIPDFKEIFDIHTLIIDELQQIENLKVIYGGSVNIENCSQIFELNTVHGALIGGSSLKFKDFLAIYKSAVKHIV